MEKQRRQGKKRERKNKWEGKRIEKEKGGMEKEERWWERREDGSLSTTAPGFAIIFGNSSNNEAQTCLP